MKALLGSTLAEVRRCTICAAHLQQPPRPVVQAGAAARIVVIGQALCSKVNECDVPWHDQSGTRLREWTGFDEATFYAPSQVALIPMGFCCGLLNR